MSQRVPLVLKRQVAKRAGFRCEYCRLPEPYFYHTFQVDHIQSLKHKGETQIENLAYSCPECNRFKGSDIATFLGDNRDVVRFFDPRRDNWFDHFEVFEGAIYPKTEIGEATIRIFQMNLPDRIIIRQELSMDGLYP